MGLNRESLKEPVHSGFEDSTGPCRFPNGPVRSHLRFSRQSALQQGRDLLVFNGPRATGAQFIKLFRGKRPRDLTQNFSCARATFSS